MGLIARRPEPFESDNAKRFTLRMDSRLFEDISTIAKLHKRSVAKEIECAIEAYVVEFMEKEQHAGDVNTPNR